MRVVLLFLLFLTTTNQLFSQNTIGVPDIINYAKDTYNGGTQNWDITQDKNGIMYFANNEGLLSFDGTSWKTYPLPNKSMVRSIAIGKDNKIYIGGQNEIGYFSAGKNGQLVYTSLRALIADKIISFKDVWDIVAYGNDIFFRSKSKIFQYSNNSIIIYPAQSEWQSLALSNNQLIAQDVNNGLLKFTNGFWRPFIQQGNLPSHCLVTSLVPFGKDSTVISTLREGLFVLTGNNISSFQYNGQCPFSNDLILSAIAVKKDWLAVGTNRGGCYIINKNREVIQNISRNEGLQNNNIVSLFVDRNNNLWLGLDNGIDFIAYNNAIKHIYPEKLNEGSGYSAIVYNNELYVGTSNGLYKIPIPAIKDLSFVNGNFKVVPNTKGTAWGLYDVNGKLLMGHHEGAFEIKDNIAFPISNHNGYWNFLPLDNVLPSSVIIAGNYNGMDLLQYKNNTFISKGNLPGFNESARFIATDNTTVWVAHQYKGVYKIDIKDTAHPIIKLYTDKNGLPSAIKNQLYKIKNRIAITTEKGIYEYNSKRDVFEPSAFFSTYFGQRNIRYLKEDAAGNIWFIEDKSLGVIDLSGPQPKTLYFPELNGKMISDFEYVYPFNAANIFVGAEKGFYHINYEQYRNNNRNILVNITTVKAIDKRDSTLYGGYFGEVNEVKRQPKNAVPKMAYNWNSFHLEYSSPLYENQPDVKYSYYLEGFDNRWSDWSKKTEKDYTNLPAGTFTFQVKAKSNLGNESAIKSYSFTVLPPWYKTPLAYILYALLFCAILYLLYKAQRKMLLQQQQKHEKEQKQLQYLHHLELEKSEKEIIALKNEKLQSEIDFKNSELAAIAMHLVQKGEILVKIKEELVRIKKVSDSDILSGDFKKLIRLLSEEDKIDKDWEQFAAHFDHVHSDFLRAVKESYPNLSANELKLCAYLRMNLSSKEIAQLMNISVRGVEISRYRLRKKLHLATETNLFDFLLEFTSSKVG